MTILADVIGANVMTSESYLNLAKLVLTEAKKLLNISQNKQFSSEDARKFISSFGVDPHVSVALFYLLSKAGNQPKMKVCHMFWTLNYLKEYPTELSLAIKFKVAPKTIKKWVDIVIDEFVALEGKLVSHLYTLLLLYKVYY